MTALTVNLWKVLGHSDLKSCKAQEYDSADSSSFFFWMPVYTLLDRNRNLDGLPVSFLTFKPLFWDKYWTTAALQKEDFFLYSQGPSSQVSGSGTKTRRSIRAKRSTAKHQAIKTPSVATISSGEVNTVDSKVRTPTQLTTASANNPLRSQDQSAKTLSNEPRIVLNSLVDQVPKFLVSEWTGDVIL